MFVFVFHYFNQQFKGFVFYTPKLLSAFFKQDFHIFWGTNQTAEHTDPVLYVKANLSASVECKTNLGTHADIDSIKHEHIWEKK